MYYRYVVNGYLADRLYKREYYSERQYTLYGCSKLYNTFGLFVGTCSVIGFYSINSGV